MLYELYAENFALMSSLRLQLGEGMNALTGETGAGKSLIVDALSLLMGARGSDSMIRSGCDRCLIEGTFLPPFPKQTMNLLNENGLSFDDSLILSRELVRGGRSIARANGRSVNIGYLRELGRSLVNLHGQREHMLLLEDAHQQMLMDSFSVGGETALAKTAESFGKLRAAQKRIAAHERDREKNAARADELRFIIEELDSARLCSGEYDQLSEEATLLAHGEKLYQAADEALEAIGGSTLDRLNDALSSLRNIASLDKNARNLYERLQNLFYEAEDISREIADYRDGVDIDAYRLEEIESRLAFLGRLRKKYFCDENELILKLDEAKREAGELEELDLSADELLRLRDQAKAEYDMQAATLTEIRRESAKKLGAAITRELAALSMPNALFRVDLLPNDPCENGNEHAIFMIRTNIGEDFQPVSRIASGGELSRIVLAIKVILARLDYVPTLIFDEVDTGLSGKALVSVAQRIAMVGESAQTVVVTHNAIMAAAAAHQILIEKHQDGDRTVSETHTLNEKERVEEIARMIAGDKVGEITLAQAEEMIEKMSQPQLF